MHNYVLGFYFYTWNFALTDPVCGNFSIHFTFICITDHKAFFIPSVSLLLIFLSYSLTVQKQVRKI